MTITPSNIKHASIDELYSARVNAWDDYFKQKLIRRWDQTWDDYHADLIMLREECGIRALEEELYNRGYPNVPSQPFMQCDSIFKHVTTNIDIDMEIETITTKINGEFFNQLKINGELTEKRSVQANHRSEAERYCQIWKLQVLNDSPKNLIGYNTQSPY